MADINKMNDELLKDIKKKVGEMNSINENDNSLFSKLNDLSKDTIDRLLKRYDFYENKESNNNKKNAEKELKKVQPVNYVRYAVLNILKKNIKIAGSTVEKIKNDFTNAPDKNNMPDYLGDKNVWNNIVDFVTEKKKKDKTNQNGDDQSIDEENENSQSVYEEDNSNNGKSKKSKVKQSDNNSKAQQKDYDPYAKLWTTHYNIFFEFFVDDDINAKIDEFENRIIKKINENSVYKYRIHDFKKFGGSRSNGQDYIFIALFPSFMSGHTEANQIVVVFKGNDVYVGDYIGSNLEESENKGEQNVDEDNDDSNDEDNKNEEENDEDKSKDNWENDNNKCNDFNEIVDKIKKRIKQNLEENAKLALTDKNIIYYGPPGTGKTYLVKEQIKLLGSEGCSKMVQCHVNFNYDDFIEGIKPLGNSNGQLKLGVVPGAFKSLCIKAAKDLGKNYYFVADEINRANISSMFGETLSLIEEDYRDYKKDNKKDDNKPIRNTIVTPLSSLIKNMLKDLVSGGNEKELKEFIRDNVYALVINDNGEKKYIDIKDIISKEGIKNINLKRKEQDEKEIIDWDNIEVEFGIPSNVYFIGMMNDVDKSIDAFDLALRRRFKWVRKDYDKLVLQEVLYDKMNAVNEKKIDSFVKSCTNLNEFIKNEIGKNYMFGHSFFMRIEKIYDKNTKNIKKEHKEYLFKNYLEPTLREYFRSFVDENELDNKINSAKEAFVNKTSKNE